MTDTPEPVERRYREMILAQPPSRRLAMAFGMFDTVRAFAEAGLRAEGVADAREMRRRLFLRFYAADFGRDERERILAALDRHAPDESVPPSR